MDVVQEELFDGDFELFCKLLKDSTCYFEYGSGKSTRWVLQNTDANVYSVDTDKNWCNTLLRSLDPNSSNRLRLFYVNVGETKNWGYPISYAKRENFIKYISGLWTVNAEPDCVLIDGRFRVACFLETVRKAPVGCRIIFDDYKHRPHYHVVEEFLSVKEYCGRQAIFEVQAGDGKRIPDALIKSFLMVMN